MSFCLEHSAPLLPGKASFHSHTKEEAEIDSRGGGRVYHLLLDCFLDASVQREVQLKALLISFSQTRAAMSIRPCGEIGVTRGVFSKQSIGK